MIQDRKGDLTITNDAATFWNIGDDFTRFPFQKLRYYEYQKEAFSQQILIAASIFLCRENKVDSFVFLFLSKKCYQYYHCY